VLDLKISPRKSQKRLTQEPGVLRTSACRATKLLKLRPGKTTVVHALKEHDPVVRIHVCNWFLRPVHDGEVDQCFSVRNIIKMCAVLIEDKLHMG
jgi:hypothetical protein